MEKLTKEEVLHVANLARLELTDDEIDEYAIKLKEILEYKNGRTNIFDFFVGMVMKETKGKANPILTKEIIHKYLDK